ncbi:MAG TPA: hypothetical protein VK612_07975 [Pyrinomonadaceae bacterium]|nr:hypothetical protein [Pyrinomonadaceae bacterium]
MRKKLLTLIGIAVLCLLTSNFVPAQDPPHEKQIKLAKGRKLVLKGEVYEGDDFYYTFKAREGQILTVKLIGRDADFTVNSNDIDVYPFTKTTKFWSGKLIGNNTNEYSIKLTSNYKSASYRLEVLLK